MFHKTRHLNHQPVKFKIKSTLLNIDAKVIQKSKKQYDVILGGLSRRCSSLNNNLILY